mmetsp:Transcript_84951/g.274619  ORF Transcript_84951/g.274619 Transcript_84951/m.274619 type:complete len:104 (-) Transcript_84951:1814-2125(-)
MAHFRPATPWTRNKRCSQSFARRSGLSAGEGADVADDGEEAADDVHFRPAALRTCRGRCAQSFARRPGSSALEGSAVADNFLEAEEDGALSAGGSPNTPSSAA